MLLAAGCGLPPAASRLPPGRPTFWNSGQAELLDQARDRHVAVLLHAVDLDVATGPDLRMLQTLLPHHALVVGAGVLGEEVLGAGVERAQVALAAELAAQDHGVPDEVEPEAAHREVGLDRVSQEVAGAELGAEAALVARRLPDQRACSIVGAVAPRKDVALGEAEQGPRRAGHDLVEALHELAHHHPAHQDVSDPVRVGTHRAQDVAVAGADRRADGHRLGHVAGDGQVLVGHRPIEGHVEQGLDVHDHAPDVEGESAGRDDPPGRFVHGQELVPGRVVVPEGVDGDPRLRLAQADLRDQVLVLLLDRDDRPIRPDLTGDLEQTIEDPVEVVPQDLLVLVEQRLALRRVHDHRVRGGLELLVGREPRTPGTDDSVRSYSLQHHRGGRGAAGRG